MATNGIKYVKCANPKCGCKIAVGADSKGDVLCSDCDPEVNMNPGIIRRKPRVPPELDATEVEALFWDSSSNTASDGRW